MSKSKYMRDMLKQVGASLFFGLSSLLIVVVNKTVLTTYRLV